MKTYNYLIISILVGIFFLSCDSVTTEYSQNLENTMWRLVVVKNAENGVNQMYPTVDKPYIVSFVGSNTLDFPYYCNISQGYYRADEDGNVTFSGFGPGTEMYCSGLTNWENMLVDNFTMNWTYQPANYTVKSDELKIVCGVVTFFFQAVCC